MAYKTKDSGQRVDYPSGMRRDIADDKPRYDLIPIPCLKRLAELYQRGAIKYGDSNWQLADTAAELQRFHASFLRHAFQWLAGEDDEDHMAAVAFNLFAYETIKEKIKRSVPHYSTAETTMALDELIADLTEESELEHPLNAVSSNNAVSLKDAGTTLTDPDMASKVKKRSLMSKGEMLSTGIDYHEKIKG